MTSLLRPLAPSPGAAEVPPWIERPRRKPGVNLHGRMPDTAFAEERWLISVGDRYHEVTPVLYHVLACADGQTPAAIIAAHVSQRCGRAISASDVRWLIANRLIPAGLIAVPATSPETTPATPTPQPSASPKREQALGLRARLPLFPYETVAPLTGLLQHLYWPPIIVGTLLLAIAAHLWLYRSPALLTGAQALLRDPSLVLLLFAMEIGSSMFHELGHAAAMRRAGCPHGPIGVAIYLIWPAFYTDVTNVYRLNRLQRLRVDLGGMYFQLFLVLLYATLYFLTGWPFWLLGIVSIDLHYMRQFTPFLRFDGYYAIADLLGVPDPLALVGPFVRDLWPWPRNRTKRLPRMRPLPRLLFFTYLVVVAYFLVYPFFLGTFYGKDIVLSLWQEGRILFQAWLAAWHIGPVMLAATTIQLIFWGIMVLGLGLFVRTASKMLLALLLAIGRRAQRLAFALRRGIAQLGQRRHALIRWALALLIVLSIGGILLPIAEHFGSQAASGTPPPLPELTPSSAAAALTSPDQLHRASTAFTLTWARLDQPVQAGVVQRTWVWGPAPRTNILVEPYAGAPGGQRLVVYYDKARMEITQPATASNASGYVTTGLLAKELITGQLQIGDATFEPKEPAQIPVAGDPTDPNAPTYASFHDLLSAPPVSPGTTLTAVVHRDGTVTDDPTLARYHITAAYFVSETNHTIASVFWDMLQAQGPIASEAGFVTSSLFTPPFYVTGLPITEAYWTRVLLNGHAHDVLVQCFERRCLTYTPDNPEGWQVEMGNVGLHYYQWRYGDTPSVAASENAASGSTPEPASPTPLPQSPKTTVVATVVVTTTGGGTASCQQDHTVQTHDGSVSATSSQHVVASQQTEPGASADANQTVTCTQHVTVTQP